MQETQLEARSSRKAFLGAGAASGLTLFLAACGGDEETPPGAGTVATTPEADDLEIVNYALTLEFLEAKFYADVIAAGVIEDAAVARTVRLIGENEREHVDVLTAVVEQLGGTPAQDPRGSFDDVIRRGEEAVLETAALVENLGAAAYLGQAAGIQGPEILAAVLSIHSVEARHAAAINQAAGFPFSTGKALEGSIPDGAFAKPLDMEQVLEEIEPFLPKQRA